MVPLARSPEPDPNAPTRGAVAWLAAVLVALAAWIADGSFQQGSARTVAALSIALDPAFDAAAEPAPLGEPDRSGLPSEPQAGDGGEAEPDSDAFAAGTQPYPVARAAQLSDAPHAARFLRDFAAYRGQAPPTV